MSQMDTDVAVSTCSYTARYASFLVELCADFRFSFSILYYQSGASIYREYDRHDSMLLGRHSL